MHDYKKVRLKVITWQGECPGPGIYYGSEEEANKVLSAVEKGRGLEWIPEQLLGWKTGEDKFEWDPYDDHPEDVRWWGIVLDEDPVVNEWGEVTP